MSRVCKRSLVISLLVAAALAWGGDSASAQAGPSSSKTNVPPAVEQLQETIVQTIATAERSVVAIARSKRVNNQGPAALRQRLLLERAAAARGLPGQVPALEVPPDPLGALRVQQPVSPPYAYGTGVVIDPSGLILTQYLVVNPEDVHTVTDVEGHVYRVSIKATDPRSGLAVLQIEPDSLPDSKEGLPTITVGKAEELRKGQFVITLGNPFALQADGQPTASWGTISNTARKAAPQENLNNTPDRRGGYRTTLHHFGSLIQTDAKLGWNAGGGAVVNLAGELVGITTTASTIAGHEQPAGYAIPLNQAMRRVIKNLSEGREAEYGLLGVTFGETFSPNPVAMLPAERAKPSPPGVQLSEAYLGSPAYRGGLRSGDVLRSVEGKGTPDPDSLQLVVGSLPPGYAAEVAYVRKGEPTTTTVHLGKAFVRGDRVVTQKPPAWRGIRVDYPTAVPSEVLRLASQQGKVDPKGCVVVAEVDPGSVSQQSGVAPYMFISHVGGKRVSTPEEFYAATSNASETVKLKFTEQLKPPGQTPDGSANGGLPGANKLRPRLAP